MHFTKDIKTIKVSTILLTEVYAYNYNTFWQYKKFRNNNIYIL